MSKRPVKAKSKAPGLPKKKKPVRVPSKCLKCGDEFMSIDVCRNRICATCTRSNCKEWSRGVHRAEFSGEALDP